MSPSRVRASSRSAWAALTSPDLKATCAHAHSTTVCARRSDADDSEVTSRGTHSRSEHASTAVSPMPSLQSEEASVLEEALPVPRCSTVSASSAAAAASSAS